MNETRASESPILLRSTKTPAKEKIDLEEIHKRLLQHLKKNTNIPRAALNLYLQQVKSLNPNDHKNRWLLMKVKGLLNYILKKRADFHCSIINGEITIYEKSASQSKAQFNGIPEPPNYLSQPVSQNFDFPSSFLTNNNFTMTGSQMEIGEHSPKNFGSSQNEFSEMSDLPKFGNNQHFDEYRTPKDIDHSRDLFSDNFQSLQSYSLQNYEMLKSLTRNSSNLSPDAKATNDESVSEIFQIHDFVHNNWNGTVSETPLLSQCQMVDMKTTATESENLYDNLNVNLEAFKEDFEQEVENTEKWVVSTITNLINLIIDEKPPTYNIVPETKQNPNAMETQTGETLRPYCSEENLKIIREVCSEFKKNLENDIKNNQQLAVLRELLNTSNQ